ncbi:hypothetical protein GCK72_015043 [Caenorhabditis remanei]|uniref:Sdz-33 F-box domain-containing protein n=1 Tax=Caenorhabditis remanei TaxID=31234 RepID=A0A6A5GVA0_CAERE|nr:hypothetical protein GCK72_015043 [Caenorhabditis remanei]KAF1758584.1 hypothetical protein GCK72_015043 [Caenorhabditis remanei]
MYSIQRWRMGETPKKIWNFKGTKIMIQKDYNCFTTKAVHSPEVQIGSILSYLMDLFKISINSVVQYDMHFPVVIPTTIQECRQLEIYNRVMNNQQMNAFLRNMPIVSKIVILNLAVENDFLCDPDINFKFSSDYLKIGNSNWITRGILFSSSCAYIELSNCRFPSEVYIDFIRNWYNSDSTRLECLEVLSTDVNLTASVFDELKPVRWDAKQRNKEFRTPSKLIDCGNGLDIVRRDGLRATIVSNNYLFFCCLAPTI